jgi:hypothetical protein
MSLRLGSGWLVIYFLICSCTFKRSAPQLPARDYTTFDPFEPLPFSVPGFAGFISEETNIASPVCPRISHSSHKDGLNGPPAREPRDYNIELSGKQNKQRQTIPGFE